MFVIDSADVGRLGEAKLAYDATCDHDSLAHVPIILLANKQDLPGALTIEDLSINFYPIQDAANRARVFPISAISGLGLEEAMNTITEEARRHCRKSGR